MITLCIHCLRPIDELRATILPPRTMDDEQSPAEPKTFVVKVQKLTASFDKEAGKAELMLDVITDEANVTPDDVQSANQFVCMNCGGVLSMQVHCYTIKGTEIKVPSEDTTTTTESDDGVEPGYVVVATMGASSRYDVRTQHDVRNAVAGLIELDESVERPEGNPQEFFEWDS